MKKLTKKEAMKQEVQRVDPRELKFTVRMLDAVRLTFLDNDAKVIAAAIQEILKTISEVQ